MIDQSLGKEFLDICEEAFDRHEQAKAIKKSAKEIIVEWAKSNKLESKNVLEVFSQYKSWREGKLKWGEEQQEDEYTSLLVFLMDAAVGDK
jgi:hypothetical protein